MRYTLTIQDYMGDMFHRQTGNLRDLAILANACWFWRNFPSDRFIEITSAETADEARRRISNVRQDR